jgi:hypothetical protein
MPWRDEGDAEGTPRPLVSVGGSFLYNLAPTDAALVGLPTDVDGDGKLDNVAIWKWGADLAARWRGASLQAELFWRRLDYGAAVPTTRRSSFGAYAQAGYFILPHRLSADARYSYAQPIGLGLDTTERAAVASEQHEATFGLSYLFFGRLVKAQVEYSYLEDEAVPEVGGGSRKSNRARAQLQFGF